jgi:hypothetical protein
MSRKLQWLALGACLGLTLGPGAPAVRAEGLSQPPESDPREQRARELFKEGSQLYDQDDFDGAIVRFQEAYRLSSLPALLFNIAQAYRLKGPGHCASALQYYQRYLRDEPTASNRQEIEELIEEMQVCAARAPDPPRVTVPPPAPPDAVPAEATRARWPRWVAIAGGCTLGLGLGGYAAALTKYESVKNGAPYRPGRFRSWEIVTDASYAMMAVGGGTVLISGAWLLAHRGHGPDPHLTVSLGLGPTVRLDGRF